MNREMNVSFNSPTFFEGLGEEIKLHIMSYLPIEDLCIMSRVSQEWNRISADNSLWKPLSLQKFSYLSLHAPTFWKGLYAAQLSSTIQIECEKFIQFPPSSLTAAIQDNRIAISTGNSVQIWDRLLKEKSSEFAVNDVDAFAFHGNYLVSCNSRSEEIKLWNLLKPNILPKSFRGHTCEVTSVAIQDETIVSGSYDKMICVWHRDSGERLAVLKGHNQSVTSVAIRDDVIVSASDDRTIRVWDRDSGECLAVHQAAGSDSFGAIAIHENIVAAALYKESLEGAVQVWDRLSGKIIEFREHTETVNSIALQDNLLITGSNDRTLRIWNRFTGKCLKTISNHTSWIDSVAIEGDTIVAVSCDKRVSIYKIHRG